MFRKMCFIEYMESIMRRACYPVNRTSMNLVDKKPPKHRNAQKPHFSGATLQTSAILNPIVFCLDNPMDLFILNDDVAQREAELSSHTGDAYIESLTQLSWHLRQRDTQRAINLADQVSNLLPTSHFSPLEQKKINARLQLIYVEASWLFADLVGAETLANNTLNEFSSILDWQGCADAHWLLAWIAVDSGKLSESDAQFEACAASAQRAGDILRQKIAETALARWAVLRDSQTAKERWQTHFENDDDDLHLSLVAWREDFFGLLTHFTGEIGLSVTQTMHAYEAALETGQIRAAIISATNISEDFNRLNDHQKALEWTQTALDLARATHWPRSIGACLMHMAENQRYIGNLDLAQDLLTEALNVLSPVINSRPYALALQYQGSVALDRNDFATALNAFQHLEKKAQELQQTDFFIDAQRGQAHALSNLNRAEEALSSAHIALRTAQEKGDRFRQIEALTVLAYIHSQHPLIAKAHGNFHETPLHYLHLVLEIAKDFSGYTISSKLLETLAREYAKVGNYEQAYAMTTQAISTREKTHSHDATNRAIAMQVTYQTERARTASEYHRKLAAAEAQKSEVLMQSSATLKQLGTIGREITAHLDSASIFQVLNRHLYGLLDVCSFAIYLLEPEANRLLMTYSNEGGQQLPIRYASLDDKNSNAARCIHENRELLCDLADDEFSHIPNTLRTLTGLFSPLTIGERQLGVITVQSMKRNAYSDSDRLIFGTLNAYAAIAINNALTYQELQATQKKLLGQEKMAALGSLVAGVAHELNTPISNSILLTSTMSHKTEIFVEKFNTNKMRRSELSTYLKESADATVINLRSLQSAAELVESFKQIAVDRTTAQRRFFNVQHFAHDIVATMNTQLQEHHVTIALEIADDLMMDSYPGPLGQVIMNFINNALRHAFDSREGGQIILSARPTNEANIQFKFTDNGNGIPTENLLKIFDPFFTTKLGQGGSGLGLSICYNIVTSILNGQITAQSELGHGTTFTLDLPFSTPN